MDIEKKFKTKTGFCHILPDKIILTRDGVIGNISEVTVGNTLWRILVIYSIIAITLLYFAFDNYKNGEIGEAIFLGLPGIFFMYAIISSLNNSATPVINRQKIKAVKLKKGITGLTRSRFEVLFEDEQGSVKKRLIMLPGSLTNGGNEITKAVKIMTDEKLITTL